MYSFDRLLFDDGTFPDATSSMRLTTPLDIKDMVNAAVHAAVWTYQEIGGYATDLVQLSYHRLPAAWGVDVNASQAVLSDCWVPLVGRIQRDVQKDHLLVAGLLFDFFQKGYPPRCRGRTNSPKNLGKPLGL